MVENLNLINSELERICVEISLHRSKLPQLWVDLKKVWDENELLWAELSKSEDKKTKLIKIQQLGDESYRRQVKNFGHQVCYFEACCSELLKLVKQQILEETS